VGAADRRIDARLVRHVELDRQDAVAVALGEIAQGIGVARRRRDLVPALEGGARGRLADHPRVRRGD
jgi:hypothetical protein